MTQLPISELESGELERERAAWRCVCGGESGSVVVGVVLMLCGDEAEESARELEEAELCLEDGDEEDEVSEEAVVSLHTNSVCERRRERVIRYFFVVVVCFFFDIYQNSLVAQSDQNIR